MAAAAAEPSTGRYQQLKWAHSLKLKNENIPNLFMSAVRIRNVSDCFLSEVLAVCKMCWLEIRMLQNEEEPGQAVPGVSDAPPPYSSISAESTAYFDYKDESGFPKPPSYNVATTLPSYDEAERSKAEATIPLVPGRDDDFVTRDDFDDTDQLRIGNDGIFMLTFFMAFLFNWIGFFLSFCLTTSAAGRYGAISGFGLSLIKWILIVRFSTYFPGYFDGQYWLWWVFLVLVEVIHGPDCRDLSSGLGLSSDLCDGPGNGPRSWSRAGMEQLKGPGDATGAELIPGLLWLRVPNPCLAGAGAIPFYMEFS
ncbi:hypothetical protein DUI87_26612 [Hirundo rustica rustica]|uniref:Nedd4 family interacting protein 1 n=1 Tax=Hirundo rustica rustica TaxID=333673 RepID=A0A3M0JCL0_HIRRU|nr:hypothetical protein DUI87_26612 [Hirundo rustica rustica]